MNIRKARPADIDAVETIYNAVLDDQEQNTNCTNWQRGSYPTRQTAETALAAGTLYVQEDDGHIVPLVSPIITQCGKGCQPV